MNQDLEKRLFGLSSQILSSFMLLQCQSISSRQDKVSNLFFWIGKFRKPTNILLFSFFFSFSQQRHENNNLKAEIRDPKYTTEIVIQEGDLKNGQLFPDFAVCDPNPFSQKKVRICLFYAWTTPPSALVCKLMMVQLSCASSI